MREIDTTNAPTLENETFEKYGEKFKRLYYDRENNIAVYRRYSPHLAKSRCVSYEVVKGQGENRYYPSTSSFGTSGWYFFGFPSKVKERIKLKFGIELK